MSDAEVILAAKATLAQACLASGVKPTEEALYWLLGLVYGESRFGQTADWVIPNSLNDESTNPGAPSGPSHNWGAVRAGATAPFIWHHDRDANGSLGKYKFARFATQLDGAKHFLSVINRGGAASVIGGQGTARDLAAAMYANHYYTGTTGSADDRINAYANMILSGAARVRKAVGAPPGQAPSQAIVQATFPWPTLFVLVAVGVGGTILLARKDWTGTTLAARVLHRLS